VGAEVAGDFAGAIIAMPALFIVAIVLHDVVERKRLPVVTAIGGGFLLVSAAVAARVADSDLAGRLFSASDNPREYGTPLPPLRAQMSEDE
jgi:O-antigen ligase